MCHAVRGMRKPLLPFLKRARLPVETGRMLIKQGCFCYVAHCTSQLLGPRARWRQQVVSG